MENLNLYRFSESFRKGHCWKHCLFKEWVSFILGSWDLFVRRSYSFPMNPEKRDTHSLNVYPSNSITSFYSCQPLLLRVMTRQTNCYYQQLSHLFVFFFSLKIHFDSSSRTFWKLAFLWTCMRFFRTSHARQAFGEWNGTFVWVLTILY